MFARNAILTALFVLMTGAMAADKPSVEARLRMEGQTQGQSTFVSGGYSAGATAPTINGNPAVEFRLGREADATGTNTAEYPIAITTRGEEHPVTNVGYHASVTHAERYTNTYSAQPENGQNNKPSVQYRLDRESQR